VVLSGVGVVVVRGETIKTTSTSQGRARGGASKWVMIMMGKQKHGLSTINPLMAMNNGVVSMTDDG